MYEDANCACMSYSTRILIGITSVVAQETSKLNRSEGVLFAFLGLLMDKAARVNRFSLYLYEKYDVYEIFWGIE